MIYITGCDGTGKTTQTQLLLDQLGASGFRVRHVWLRYPFFLSIPLLVYARWRGLSWYEVNGLVRHGYWNFSPSWLMRKVFPRLLLVDAGLAGILRIYLPILFGYTVVCERFTLDMVVDLSVAMDDLSFLDSGVAAAFIRLIPKNRILVLLDLDAAEIKERRKDLVWDQRLEARLLAFRKLAVVLGIGMLKTEEPIDAINRQVQTMIGLPHAQK
ncbi:MAG TPA: hypothetical protein VMC09_02820 [Anaerolineales bacterium]|nr:hypothetical protein [Anaerolineales bacterium]